ncbi:MAG: restriction endonuclease [Acidimicrobiaceae bacterium]|nr:restriction endonuclease [Acidimicrobiaceae bacterium]
MAQPTIPNQFELMWPTLEALKALGGSGRIEEIFEAVVEQQGFSEDQLAVRRKNDDRMSRVEYHLAWARNGLKHVGAIENSSRGVWAITERGRQVTENDVLADVKAWRTEYNRQYQARKRDELTDDDANEDLLANEPDWTQQLLDRLLDLTPDAFERLAKRVLREAGFRNVEVLGKPGDGGIDGVGVYRISLVSFPVYFQCKRYRQSVGPDAVRDFRGAMAGRGEKGLLITTANFTPSALEEANRDGAPPVDLVNGEELCELLKEYELGVSTRIREVEDVEIHSEYFDQV